MRHPLDYGRSDPEIRKLERAGVRQLTASRWSFLLVIWALF